MPRSISRTPLHVCLVTQNCLAEAYLEQLLRAVPHIRPLTLKQCACLSATCRKIVIFVIDLCGLGIPLCECLKQLRHHCHDARFLVLDQPKADDEILRMLIMGVHGYIPHAEASRTLLHAISNISANQLWVPPEVFSKFLCEVGCALRKENYVRRTTTPREDEILELVRRRLSNREIAELLQIRVSTVKFHISNIFSKLHASSRRELAVLQMGNVRQALL